MSMTSAWVVAERLAIADLFESLAIDDGNVPSFCAGWRVRDVAGHLLWEAEMTPALLAASVVRSGPVPRSIVAAEGIRRGMLPANELVRRLRAAPPPRSRMVRANLADVVVHAQDMLRPLGRAGDGRYGTLADLPAAAVADVFDTYTTRYRHRARLPGGPPRARFVATDLATKRGEGPTVEGRAIDLILYASGRQHRVRELLTGDGLR